ncbi:MAG: polysulfide reductase NrfD [Actinobacteria bacterium]|nr:polysulfide reductase NrfD [Actinomycetota bacterium]
MAVGGQGGRRAGGRGHRRLRAMKAREELMVPKADVRTYYDRPVLKAPVWKWYIPAYFFTGGLAGASSVLGLGAQLTGRRALRRASRVAAFAGIGASAGLLVVDLGRPSRFHNMLRVLKVTSPMSVGSWLLAAYGPAAGVAAVPEITGWFPRLGAVAGVAAGVLGPAVTTYTAVLVSDTAIPAWHEAHAQLPYVFAGGAAATAGGLAAMCAPAAEAGPARRLALMGAALELGATQLMEERLGEAGAPYHEGEAGRLTKLSKMLVGAGAVAIAVGRKRRTPAVVGGGLLVAGALAERMAVFHAGKQSARDPAAVVAPQRRRLAAGRTPTGI